MCAHSQTHRTPKKLWASEVEQSMPRLPPGALRAFHGGCRGETWVKEKPLPHAGPGTSQSSAPCEHTSRVLGIIFPETGSCKGSNVDRFLWSAAVSRCQEPSDPCLLLQILAQGLPNLCSRAFHTRRAFSMELDAFSFLFS